MISSFAEPFHNGLFFDSFDSMDNCKTVSIWLSLQNARPKKACLPFQLERKHSCQRNSVLLFRLAGLSVLNIWGGTAGNWGRRTLDQDEMEIMVVACKTGEPSAGGDAL